MKILNYLKCKCGGHLYYNGCGCSDCLNLQEKMYGFFKSNLME